MSTPDPHQDRGDRDPADTDRAGPDRAEPTLADPNLAEPHLAEAGPAAAPKPAPTLAEHLKWSALMILIVVLLARIATPILRWLGFE